MSIHDMLLPKTENPTDVKEIIRNHVSEISDLANININMLNVEHIGLGLDKLQFMRVVEVFDKVAERLETPGI